MPLYYMVHNAVSNHQPSNRHIILSHIVDHKSFSVRTISALPALLCHITLTVTIEIEQVINLQHDIVSGVMNEEARLK